MIFEGTLKFIAERVQEDELWPKLATIIDSIVAEYQEDIEDMSLKRVGTPDLRETAIKEMITELGFDYVRQLMDTLENVQFNILLDFVSLLKLLKGHRRGLELILELLGFDSIIQEWWEIQPPKEEMTFDLTVIVTSSTVPDLNTTLDKVKIFTRHYVLPKLELIDFKFVLGSFLEYNLNVAGFVKMKHFGRISRRLGT